MRNSEEGRPQRVHGSELEMRLLVEIIVEMKKWKEATERTELQRKINECLKGEPVVPLCTYIGEFERLTREKA